MIVARPGIEVTMVVEIRKSFSLPKVTCSSSITVTPVHRPIDIYNGPLPHSLLPTESSRVVLHIVEVAVKIILPLVLENGDLGQVA